MVIRLRLKMGKNNIIRDEQKMGKNAIKIHRHRTKDERHQQKVNKTLADPDVRDENRDNYHWILLYQHP